jgi:hypothetical protein
MKPIEAVLAIVFAGMATAIAIGAIQVPTALTGSSIFLALLLILVLSIFAYSPVAGIAAVALFAVIVFNRNVRRIAMYAKKDEGDLYEAVERGTYDIDPLEVWGDEKIYKARVGIPQGLSGQVRSDSGITATYNVTWVPLSTKEGFTSTSMPYSEIDNFGQAVDGQYPINQNRVHLQGTAQEHFYAPAEDTGSNEFSRFGPDMDEKVDALQY